jgi:hypothetical protein
MLTVKIAEALRLVQATFPNPAAQPIDEIIEDLKEDFTEAELDRAEAYLQSLSQHDLHVVVYDGGAGVASIYERDGLSFDDQANLEEILNAAL